MRQEPASAVSVRAAIKYLEKRVTAQLLTQIKNPGLGFGKTEKQGRFRVVPGADINVEGTNKSTREAMCKQI